MTSRLDPEKLRPLDLSPAQIDAAGALAKQAHWNQIAADWRLMLSIGRGFGLSAPGEKLVATGITLPFTGGGFGWISMILVDETCRRLGLGKRMMQFCLDELAARRLTPMLDATPAGRELYLTLGFVDLWRLTRLTRRDAGRVAFAAPPDSGIRIAPFGDADWSDALALDRQAFGADRAPILRDLARRRPNLALAARRGGRLTGFSLARDGRVATHLGPIVATDAATADALLAVAFARQDAPFYIDVPDAAAALQEKLAASGFVAERPFIRMACGTSKAPGDASLLYAVAGPELG
ncbi:MAG: GNAT family N-acetyltransferase [Alphaproteobacteria bacterium]